MAELLQQKIAIHELIPGMYVSRLDRPWIGTPFRIQGFHIKDKAVIDELGRYCQYVYIDMQRSRIHRQTDTAQASPRTKEQPIRLNHTIYRRTQPMKDEVVRAARLHQDVAKAIARISDQVNENQAPDIPLTRQTANHMVDSVASNPDALIWVAQLKTHDAHSYHHSIRSAIWAIAFGRHLGMRKRMLQDLAMGMLLADIGLTRIPTEIIEKPFASLTEQERKLYQTHVTYSLELLKESRGLSGDSLELIASHHERHNGTGYPRRLRGERIPLFGRIAGIVDYYDTLTNPRRQGQVFSPGDAIVDLHKQRHEAFQGELIDEFIQAIGIYPTGSLVEFKSGEVAIISEQNEGWRLRPRVLLLLDEAKQELGTPREVNLLDDEDETAMRLEIRRGLPDNSFGIDLGQLRSRRLARFLGRGNSLLIN